MVDAYFAMDEEEKHRAKLFPPGYAKSLLRFCHDELGFVEYPGQFKYVIVPLGSNARTTSGRLAYLLSHSGAVVLLQTGNFAYHFSSRLQPWVHYVPLTYTMSGWRASLIEFAIISVNKFVFHSQMQPKR